MPFDWKAFLELARTLQQRAGGAANPEAFLRTALSRAYYAAFGQARAYARDWLGFQSRNDPEDHGRLRAHLRSRRRKGDADRLDRLRQWCNAADYLDDLTMDLPTAVTTALGEADRVFASLAPPKQV